MLSVANTWEGRSFLPCKYSILILEHECCYWDDASFKDTFLFYLRVQIFVSPDDCVAHNICASCKF
jgi:hypothetical protein